MTISSCSMRLASSVSIRCVGALRVASTRSPEALRRSPEVLRGVPSRVHWTSVRSAPSARGDRDLTGLRGRASRDPQHQHAMAMDGLHVVLIDLGRELERAPEASDLSLATVEARALHALVLGLALAADRDGRSLERDVQILGDHAGNLGRQDIAFLGLIEIDGRIDAAGSLSEGSGATGTAVHAAKELVEDRC